MGRVQRSLVSFAVFFAVACVVVGGIHYYLWYRLVRSPDLPWARAGAWIFAGLGVLLPILFQPGQQAIQPGVFQFQVHMIRKAGINVNVNGLARTA